MLKSRERVMFLYFLGGQHDNCFFVPTGQHNVTMLILQDTESITMPMSRHSKVSTFTCTAAALDGL
jgi:hypothetical protein